MATQGMFNPGQEQATVTASPNISTVQARFDPNADVNSLVSALGSDANMNRANSMYAADMKRKTLEQTAKIESYTQQIADSTVGQRSVSAAQIKEISPELVPTLRFALAEKLGKMQGVKDAQALVAGIDADASFLDTDKRNAYTAEQRAKLISEIPEGNDFFKAGVIQGIDAQFAQNQQRWQAKTDQYHNKVEREYLSGETVTALNMGGDIKASLLQLDKDRKGNASLNNEESKNTIVESVIETAMTQKNPDFLDQIPDALLNSSLKVKVDQARGRILERSMSDDRYARAKRDDDRQEADRVAFQEINTAVAQGTMMNPMDYLHLSPAVYTYALSARDRPTLPASESAANVSRITEEILTSASVGRGKGIGELTDLIQNNSNINSPDKVKLIEKLSTLVEGRTILSDPRLALLISRNIAPALADMQQHIEVRMNRFDGISLRADVMKRINERVRSSFISSQATTGAWPTGDVATALIDQAVAEGSAMITNRLKTATENQAASLAPNPRPRTPRAEAVPVDTRPVPSAVPRPKPPAPAANSIDDAVAAELARRQ
jgi:hypothetical protein